jgi:acylphosphatase
MLCYRVYITGKVQGVSFRYHTHALAAKLKLSGFVRNLDDGRVEIFVCGPGKDVEHLISWARRGPSEADVKAVEVLNVKDEFPMKPFYIRRDGGKP